MSSDGSSEDEEGGPSLDFGRPDDVDVSVELKNWLFALEGAQERAERWWFHDEDVGREDRCWHTMFQSLLVNAKSSPKNVENGTGISPQSQKYPVELVTVSTFIGSFSQDTFKYDIMYTISGFLC